MHTTSYSIQDYKVSISEAKYYKALENMLRLFHHICIPFSFLRLTSSISRLWKRLIDGEYRALQK